ncbi:phosphopantetheine-binding protein [Mycobacterium intracellulare]|uniref:phosphopantetheine-binding protein n=1 Tax=Mycobacterium intracellulare TaxID=1767 RepID=UPI001EEF47C2|nr:phosphopantetheine-binding protein [Mycobacterium intracellulare]MEE3755349.1 phosphopantetheine-binding protein [Mycobacterium intracellulare]
MDIASIEKEIIDWCRELGLRVTSADDDFFACGGTSLTAVKLMTHTDTRYGEDALSPDALYERSSIQQIAQTIHANLLESAPQQ